MLEYHPVPTDWVYIFNVRTESGRPDYNSCLRSILFPAYDGPRVSYLFTGYVMFTDEEIALEWFERACAAGVFLPTDSVVRNMLMWREVHEFINIVRTRYRRYNPFTNTHISGVMLYSSDPLYYSHGIPVHCDFISV